MSSIMGIRLVGATANRLGMLCCALVDKYYAPHGAFLFSVMLFNGEFNDAVRAMEA